MKNKHRAKEVAWLAFQKAKGLKIRPTDELIESL